MPHITNRAARLSYQWCLAQRLVLPGQGMRFVRGMFVFNFVDQLNFTSCGQ